MPLIYNQGLTYLDSLTDAFELNRYTGDLLENFEFPRFFNQSQHLYLEAAGSEGKDDTVPGIHLRWSFVGELAEKHLPKGSYSSEVPAFTTDFGYNKPEDYVYLFRHGYKVKAQALLDFRIAVPETIVEAGPERYWTFPAQPGPQIDRTQLNLETTFKVSFLNIGEYDQVREQWDPRQSLTAFLQQYQDILQVEAMGELFFAAELSFQNQAGYTGPEARVETISVPGKGVEDNKIISCRRRFGEKKIIKVPGLSRSELKLVSWVERHTPEYRERRAALDKAILENRSLQLEIENRINYLQLRELEAEKLKTEITRIGKELYKHPELKAQFDQLVEREAALMKELPYLNPILEERNKIYQDQIQKIAEEEKSLANDFEKLWDRIKPILEKLGTWTGRLSCDNIQAIRMQCKGVHPERMLIETYEDYQQSVSQGLQGESEMIKALSLTLDIKEVLRRLRKPDEDIMEQWPKYNDGAKLVTDNYLDRWNKARGLKEAVMTYMHLSRTSYRAELSLPAEDPNDDGVFPISYLEMLGLVGLDYHAARILGLGHIDYEDEKVGSDFIYQAVYYTKYVENGVPGGIHSYYTIPTSRKAYRTPPKPKLLPVEYGMTVENATGETALTDPEGYAPFDNIRFVRIKKAPYPYEVPFGPFWGNGLQFCRCEWTRPVRYGLEYKEHQEGNWRRPELNHDPEYKDQNGIPETIGIPEHGDTVFVHPEREEGIHSYGLYSINWFSRVSDVGKPVKTDFTRFKKPCTLKAPANINVQYIQPENPRIMTTAREQAMLEGLDPEQEFPTRITFEWDHTHNTTYSGADSVDIFFRDAAPEQVLGKIFQIEDQGGGQIRVRTEALALESLGTGESMTPLIAPADWPRFIGSKLVSDGNAFEILAIQAPTGAGEGSDFILRELEQKRPIEEPDPEEGDSPEGSTRYVTITEPLWPETGAQFMVLENLSDESNWSQLAKTIALQDFGSDYTETETNASGEEVELTIGGLVASCTITELPQIYGNTAIPPQQPNDPIPGSRSGVYEITFPGAFVLNAHPDPDVEWYKGTIRISDSNPVAAERVKKALKIYELKRDIGTGALLNPLQVIAFDPEYEADPASGRYPIQTGAAVEVNFHPGYRAYLYPEAGIFEQAHILPTPGQGTRQTFLALRASDEHSPGQFCRSELSTPVVLLGREISDPVPPGIPVGPTFATRPDYFGRSTYTMDMSVDTTGGRAPYAMIFYRGTERAILRKLYQTITVEAIYASLAPLKDDEWYSQRWVDLVNLELEGDDVGEPDTGLFKAYGDSDFRFPEPDNSLTDPAFDGQTPAGNLREAIEAAILSVFKPLTANPIVYQFLRTGYQTSPDTPTIRDANGNLLKPATTGAYNAAPMCTRLPGSTSLRFTDYTLDGASRNHYFYYGREIGIDGKLSGPGPIAGPILMVNAKPASPPAIRKVTVQTENPIMGVLPAVKLEVNAYSEKEGISAFRIYRSTDNVSMQSVRTMDHVRDVPLGEALTDTFADLPYPPFGDPLFYRVVALREIKNEQGEAEHVPSEPSDPALTNLIDVVNPDAPVLTASPNPSLSTPTQHRNTSLRWSPTTYGGTYYLMRMTAGGSWEKFYEVTGEDPEFEYPPAGDFLSHRETLILEKETPEGQPRYHHFKVSVQNASGLLNREDRVCTLGPED